MGDSNTCSYQTMMRHGDEFHGRINNHATRHKSPIFIVVWVSKRNWQVLGISVFDLINSLLCLGQGHLFLNGVCFFTQGRFPEEHLNFFSESTEVLN